MARWPGLLLAVLGRLCPGCPTGASKDPLRLAQANLYLGRLYRVERGLRAAQEAVRLNPASAEAWDALGWGLYPNLRPEEAMTALARALELAPDLAAAHYHLGVIHERQGNHPAAAKAYQQAAARDRSGTYGVRAQQAPEGLH